MMVIEIKCRLHPPAVLASLLLLCCIGQVSAQKQYDIVVYGGSSGGFAAAVQAGKMGKSVALLEPSNHVGGMNVEGLGGTDIDNHPEFRNSPAVGGMALEFYRRIARAYGKTSEFEEMLRAGTKKPALWRFEPHVAQKVIDDWLGEYPIDVFRGARLQEGKKSVVKKDTRITAIRTSKGTFQGAVFIDGTIEGDLLAAAGVSTAIGREPNSQYSETKNGIRAETTHNQFAVKVDPYRIPGDPGSGVITGVTDEPFGEPGAGDHRLQAYCFRVCLTDNPENRVPLPKPHGYNRKDYELFERYVRAGGKLYKPYASLPNRKTDFNGGRDVSHNLNGMNFGYPGGSYKTRKKIVDYHRSFTQGLFYFLANDPEIGRLDPQLQKEWAQWGLTRDEFTDNNGWPRIFYVRDARRMISDYIITEHHVRKDNPVAVEDPVGMAYWPPDVHNVRTIVKDGHAYNEGFVFGGNDWIPFGVSYRALVPKASECTNLLTPTCPSSSHIAYGAIRIEFTFIALGQACGAAAALAAQHNTTAQNVPYELLRKKLLDEKQVLEL